MLGAGPEATFGELRRNMALLLRWLHPDHDRRGERAVFAARVTRAWSDLKTQERREMYDRSLRLSPSRAREKEGTRAQLNRHGPNHRWDHGRRYGGLAFPACCRILVMTEAFAPDPFVVVR